jgi:hypothetical protein
MLAEELAEQTLVCARGGVVERHRASGEEVA